MGSRSAARNMQPRAALAAASGTALRGAALNKEGKCEHAGRGSRWLGGSWLLGRRSAARRCRAVVATQPYGQVPAEIADLTAQRRTPSRRCPSVALTARTRGRSPSAPKIKPHSRIRSNALFTVDGESPRSTANALTPGRWPSAAYSPDDSLPQLDREPLPRTPRPAQHTADVIGRHCWPRRAALSKHSSRPLVRLRHPCRVDPERGHTAPTVPEPAGNGPHVDAGCDELGRGVVPQAMQVRVDVEPLREPAVPLRHR